MDKVHVRFSNIQSHENTSFVLMPGLNFILANDNNVGKSTIFKVFTAIAKAPNVSADKLRALMRTGCVQAYAAFDYDGQRTVAWFQKDDRRAPYLFFEHIDKDGEATRSLAAPLDLIRALDISIDESGDIINFNDADSIQLISKKSAEADSILTSVILDVDVEQMKANLIRFSKELDGDIKMTSIKKKDSEDALERLHFNPVVDTFFKELPVLQVLCKLADIAPKFDQRGEVVDDNVMTQLSSMMRLAQEIDSVGFDKFYSHSVVDECVAALHRVVSIIREVDLQVLGLCEIEESERQQLDALQRVMQVLGQATLHAWRCHDLGIEQVRAQNESERLRDLLRAIANIVTCPVKGDVIYSDEGCLPFSD